MNYLEAAKLLAELFHLIPKEIADIDAPDLIPGELGIHYASGTMFFRNPITGETISPNRFDANAASDLRAVLESINTTLYATTTVDAIKATPYEIATTAGIMRIALTPIANVFSLDLTPTKSTDVFGQYNNFSILSTDPANTSDVSVFEYTDIPLYNIRTCSDILNVVGGEPKILKCVGDYKITSNDIVSAVTNNANVNFVKIQIPKEFDAAKGIVLEGGFTLISKPSDINTTAHKSMFIDSGVLWVGFSKATTLSERQTMLLDKVMLYGLTTPVVISSPKCSGMLRTHDGNSSIKFETSMPNINAMTIAANVPKTVAAALKGSYESHQKLWENIQSIERQIGYKEVKEFGKSKQVSKNKVSGTPLLLMNVLKNGKRLSKDAEFMLGSNSIIGLGTHVTLSRVTDSACPNKGKNVLRLTHAINTAENDLGGFQHPVNISESSIISHVFTAKLPIGFSFSLKRNSMSSDSVCYFVGSAEGTGKYETYAVVYQNGEAAMNNMGSIAVIGTVNKVEPFFTYIASSQIYELTNLQEEFLLLEDISLTPSANKVARMDANGKHSIDTTGNAATATKLATARAINGVNFDGTSSITIADDTKIALSLFTAVNDFILGNGSGVAIKRTLAETKTILSINNVDNTSDANKPLSNAQIAALALKEDKANKGVANGYASLDSGGKLTLAQIPDSILGQVEYMGTWNASTNTPTLAATPANKGIYYITSVAGTQFSKSFEVGDWIVSNGTTWDKVDNTDAVSSVAGRTGAVVLTKTDVGLSNVDNTADTAKVVLSASKLTTARTISISGDATASVSFDGSANAVLGITFANTGVAAGTYKSVTVDAKGRVTAGTNPTTLSDYGITDAVAKNTSFGDIRSRRDVAIFSGVGTPFTGAIKITLPASWTSTMMNIEIAAYNYAEFTNAKILLSGYNFNPGTAWINTSAKILGSLPTDLIRFGHDGTNCCIILGDITTQWSYPKLVITRVDTAHDGKDSLNGTWSMSQITSLTGITGLVTAPVNVGLVSDKLRVVRSISLTGDATGSANFDGSANAPITMTLANSGVSAGTYKSVTVDAKGRVTGGTNPTTLSAYGITDSIQASLISELLQGNRNLIVSGGGTMAWGATANVFSWSKDFIIYPAGGKLLVNGVAIKSFKVLASSATLTTAGSCLVITLPTADGASATVAVSDFSAITGTDKMILAVRDVDSCLELIGGGWIVYGDTIQDGGMRQAYVPTSIISAANDFIVGSGSKTVVKKTLAETKTILGISNVDNTSDVNKPVSTAQATALALKENTANKGVANGYASLDSGGKLTLSQVPASLMGQVEYMGVWNASTNSPALTATPASKGIYYITSVAGTQFSKTFDVGDWIVSNGTTWDKVDNTDAVSSVAGRTGAIVLTKSDVGLANVDNTADAAKAVLSATKLATPRAINGVNFDGTAAITIADSTKIPLSLFTAANDFILGNGSGTAIKKTLAETKTILGLNAADLLAAIKTVDGSGSGLDADTVASLTYSKIYKGDGGGYTSGNIHDLPPNALTVINPGVTGLPFGEWWLGFNEYLGDGGTNKLTLTSLTNPGKVFFKRRVNAVWDTGWTQVWTSDTDGSGSGLDADKVRGVIASGPHPAAGSYIPIIDNSGGVLEVGRYIDFHKAGNTNDFDGRLYISDGNELVYAPNGQADGTVVTTSNSSSKLTQFARKDIQESRTNKETFYIPTNTSGATGNGLSTLEVFSPDGTGDAYMALHNSGAYACHFGLDRYTADLFVGGWSMGNVKHRIFHAGNYGAITSQNTSIYVTMLLTNKVVLMYGASTQVVEIHSEATYPHPIGTQITFTQWSTGAVVFAAGGGVYLVSKDSKRTISGQFASATLIKVEANSWLLVGDIKA